MDNNKIIIIGAKENNLKNISLDIDKHKFNVVTGVSGSGKSSLVFDCIYASAQSSLYTEIFTYKRANKKITIIDNYIDNSILKMLTKKNKNVEVIIITSD